MEEKTMISWLLQKIKSWSWFGYYEPKLVEGIDYEVVDIDDSDIVEIVLLRGPDKGQKIRLMRRMPDEDRNNNPQESNT